VLSNPSIAIFRGNSLTRRSDNPADPPCFQPLSLPGRGRPLSRQAMRAGEGDGKGLVTGQV
jgi:hypothetical protein